MSPTVGNRQKHVFFLKFQFRVSEVFWVNGNSNILYFHSWGNDVQFDYIICFPNGLGVETTNEVDSPS